MHLVKDTVEDPPGHGVSKMFFTGTDKGPLKWVVVNFVVQYPSGYPTTNVKAWRKCKWYYLLFT